MKIRPKHDCINYILIIIYKMASLLALMNRAITYFKEPKSVTSERVQRVKTSGTNSEVSTDDESAMKSEVSTDVDRGSSDDGMLTDDINTYEDTL
jgi:hypothetical protein